MALRTGAEYLQALRDGREVYLDGRRVADVTSEPGLARVAHTFARMYDLVIENQDQWTFRDEQGQPTSLNWLQPRTRAELTRRRNFTEMIARRTGGVLTSGYTGSTRTHTGFPSTQRRRAARRREDL